MNDELFKEFLFNNLNEDNAANEFYVNALPWYLDYPYAMGKYWIAFTLAFIGLFFIGPVIVPQGNVTIAFIYIMTWAAIWGSATAYSVIANVNTPEYYNYRMQFYRESGHFTVSTRKSKGWFIEQTFKTLSDFETRGLDSDCQQMTADFLIKTIINRKQQRKDAESTELKRLMAQDKELRKHLVNPQTPENTL